MSHGGPHEVPGDIQVQRIAAFSDGAHGGNPAGIAILDRLPCEGTMQRIAAAVGDSETAFAACHMGVWRVRYFSPETEIPFCGHATIALGAVLAATYGDGRFRLELNEGEITVEAQSGVAVAEAALVSPRTRSSMAPESIVDSMMKLFDYTAADLDSRLTPALAHAGANHLIVPLATRAALAVMRYDLGAGRHFMRENDLVTIAFVYAETFQLFHARNAFASGGVYEDPATGAAAAALAGYLRDVKWPHGGAIEITQGEDLGARSKIRVSLTSEPGSSVRVSGSSRPLCAPLKYACQ